MRTKDSNVKRHNYYDIYQKVNLILKKYKKNNSFVVGVSGGPDSLALVSITKSIAVEKIPNIGFGEAINDRLIRASKF